MVILILITSGFVEANLLVLFFVTIKSCSVFINYIIRLPFYDSLKRVYLFRRFGRYIKTNICRPHYRMLLIPLIALIRRILSITWIIFTLSFERAKRVNENINSNHTIDS